MKIDDLNRYGELPARAADYPLEVGALWVLDTVKLVEAGIALPRHPACPANGSAGELFATGLAPMWRPQTAYLFQPGPLVALSNSSLVEVCHRGGSAASDEAHGAWFYRCSGSGIWLDLGRTISFGSAAPAHSTYLHELAFVHFFGDNTSAWGNEALARRAAVLGYDTIQFVGVDNADGSCDGGQGGVRPLQYEFVVRPCARR